MRLCRPMTSTCAHAGCLTSTCSHCADWSRLSTRTLAREPSSLVEHAHDHACGCMHGHCSPPTLWRGTARVSSSALAPLSPPSLHTHTPRGPDAPWPRDARGWHGATSTAAPPPTCTRSAGGPPPPLLAQSRASRRPYVTQMRHGCLF